MNPDQNRRILVIDDNRAIHNDFRKILSPDASTKSDLKKTQRLTLRNRNPSTRQ